MIRHTLNVIPQERYGTLSERKKERFETCSILFLSSQRAINIYFHNNNIFSNIEQFLYQLFCNKCQNKFLNSTHYFLYVEKTDFSTTNVFSFHLQVL